jgi:NADPH:quinone reductase-like Zn-dependent oxidoreductase
MSFESAATLGSGILTVGQNLYQSLSLPLPKHSAPGDTFVLVYSGSTATGSLAIQFAKL